MRRSHERVRSTGHRDAHGRDSAARGALRVIAPVPLPAIFTGYGPLPAVRATRERSGDWATVGETRVVEFADGSTTREQLTAHAEPGYFAYRVHAFTGPLRWLVRDAVGEWQLS